MGVETVGSLYPIVILGGVAHYDGAYNLAKGFDQVYVPPNTAIKYNSPSPDGFESRDSSKYFKPLAGVKSISSTFEGATKSLRKIIVNWTVYDLDELEILTPHFLSPGKWTLLEMGWNYADKVFDKKLIGDKLFQVKRSIFCNGVLLFDFFIDFLESLHAPYVM